jgi:hypothetical protein
MSVAAPLSHRGYCLAQLMSRVDSDSVQPRKFDAYADNGNTPTPEELKMISDPAAPGGAVICLSMDVRDDHAKTETHSIYVRLKILNDKGREYADVEIPYTAGVSGSKRLRGARSAPTAPSSRLPLKPYDEVTEKGKFFKKKAKVLTLIRASMSSKNWPFAGQISRCEEADGCDRFGRKQQCGAEEEVIWAGGPQTAIGKRS